MLDQLKLLTNPEVVKYLITNVVIPKIKKQGFTKLSLYLGLSLYALYAILKNNGYLGKKSVKGQHIFITGAGSGIGRQMAIRFARLGAKVTVSDVNMQGAQQTEEIIKKLGFNQVQAILCDVSNSEKVKVAAEQARQTYGNVDILINNAGIVSGKKLLQNSLQMIEKTVQVNTVSHAYTVKEFLPKMLEKNSGHIVTIASQAGILGVAGLADYCASKFGAFGFDESLRMELKTLNSNVKTTCICPYYINTGMFEGAKSRFNFLLPILSEQYASDRIVNAILQEEPICLLPWIGNVIILARALLPVSLFDAIVTFLGANNSMDDFKGRGH